MIKKMLLCMLLFIILMHSKVISAEGFKYAEIFDPRQEKVVKVVQINTEIYNFVASEIKDVDGIYGKNNPVIDDGYAIRIPLDPAIKLQGKWINTLADEVFIVIPKKDPPFFIIFENDNKLCCFPFKGDIDTLSKAFDFNLKYHL